MEVTEKIAFTPERLKKAKEYIARYPEGKQKSAILPIMHLAQEQYGWMSVPVMDYVAEMLDIQPIEVYEVATFYTMFHLEPVGEHVIEYCRTGPCCNLGGEDVYGYLSNKLGISANETTSDGKFTLKEVECIASCGWGPVFQVKDKIYYHLDNQRVDEIIEELSK